MHYIKVINKLVFALYLHISSKSRKYRIKARIKRMKQHVDCDIFLDIFIYYLLDTDLEFKLEIKN